MEQRTKVLWVEDTEFPDGWGIREHSHEYYHLFYFLSGKGIFFIEKIPYDVYPDLCIIVPPGTLHGLQKVEGDALKCYEVKFSIFDDYLKNNFDLSNPVLPGNEFIKTLISYIVENGQSRVPQINKNVDAFLCTLIVSLSGSTDTARKKQSSQYIDTSTFSDVTTSIILYIDKNYMNQISLDMIAEHVDYNRNYICTRFKKDTGISIIDYLNYVRIRQAAQYFSYSDIDISQVCSRVGFTNISHFNRTFKKFSGISPGTFRKMFPVDINGYLGYNNGGDSESQAMDITQALASLGNQWYPKPK